MFFQDAHGHGLRALQARQSGEALTATRAAVTLHGCRQWLYEGSARLSALPRDVAVDYLERESAHLADTVIAPSRFMADWAAVHWRLASCDVLPSCHDATLGRTPERVAHEGPFEHLVFLGPLERRAGLDLFCQAAHQLDLAAQGVTRVTFLGACADGEGGASEAFVTETMARVPGVSVTLMTDLGSRDAITWLTRLSRTLVVAPRLAGNLPSALVELFARRVPFVATDVGGIVEIVGDANRHLLARPTIEDLTDLLEPILAAGALTIDYRSGYDVAAANRRHVHFVEQLLQHSPAETPVVDAPFDIVVAGDSDPAALRRLHARVTGTDAAAVRGAWRFWADWREAPAAHPAVFIDPRVEPARGLLAGLFSSLLAALQRPGVDLATSYYETETSGTNGVESTIVAPLGASLEAGWATNCFGGPCFAANPSAFPYIQDAIGDRPFSAWPAYAAVACAGLVQALVPSPLYLAPEEALRPAGVPEAEAVIRQYHLRSPDRIDLGWVLKSVLAPATDGPARPGDIQERGPCGPDAGPAARFARDAVGAARTPTKKAR